MVEVKEPPITEQLSFDEVLYPEIKPTYWVNQSNSLINLSQDLAITERRIVYTLITLVQPDDQDFKTYVIRVKDLADLIGYKGKSIYEQVDKAVKGIMEKHIAIYSPDGKKIIDRIQWVQRATYPPGEGIIRIRLSDGLAQYLLNLKSYTKYRLFNVLKLSSEYSWRIYELLKEDEWKNRSIEQKTKNGTKKWKSHRVIKVDDLRRILNVPDDTLTMMKHFKQVVLDKAKKELKEKTDLVFDYEGQKVGRKIDSFIFYINENKNYRTGQVDIDAARNDLQSMIFLFIRHGVRRQIAVELVDTYTYEYLDANMRHVLHLPPSKVKNKAGYIIQAIEGNYAEYEGLRKKEDEDPIHRIFSHQIDQKLKEQTEKDNAILEQTLKHYEDMLQTISSIDLKGLSDRRHKSVLEQIVFIQEERKQRGLPQLIRDDIKHATAKSIFRDWEAKIVDFTLGD